MDEDSPLVHEPFIFFVYRSIWNIGTYTFIFLHLYLNSLSPSHKDNLIMPRNQGTSSKGKPKKLERAAGFGRALQR